MLRAQMARSGAPQAQATAPREYTTNSEAWGRALRAAHREKEVYGGQLAPVGV